MVWQETPRQSTDSTWPLAANKSRSNTPSRRIFHRPRSLVDLSAKKPDTRGTLGGFMAIPILSDNSQLSSSDKRKGLYLGTDTDSRQTWYRRSTGSQLTEATRWTMDFDAIHSKAPMTPPETPVDNVVELEWKGNVVSSTSSVTGDDSGWESENSQQPVELPANDILTAPSSPAITVSSYFHELDSYQFASPKTISNHVESALCQPPKKKPEEDTFEPTLSIRRSQPIMAQYCTIQPINPAQESVHRRGLHKVKGSHSLRRHRNASITSESTTLPAGHFVLPKRPHIRSYGSHSRASRSRNGSADFTALAMMAKNVPTITVTNPTVDHVEPETRAKSWPQARDDVNDENVEEEAKWEEITEPDDLKLCLAVLNKEIERRRREFRS